MQNTRKNYLIYVIMLLLFGGLIYMAIAEGERFQHLSSSHSIEQVGSAFVLFKTILMDNLKHPLSTLLIQIIVVLLAVRQLGLVLFMFVIGMEVDFRVLKNKINETLVISHAGILVPFFLGIVASYWIYEEYAAQHTAFIPFALFIGISMSITAFPVLARIIQERNLTHKPIGILTIASATNDDVTAWCLLAVVI